MVFTHVFVLNQRDGADAYGRTRLSLPWGAVIEGVIQGDQKTFLVRGLFFANCKRTVEESDVFCFHKYPPGRSLHRAVRFYVHEQSWHVLLQVGLLADKDLQTRDY